jgi:DNA processing protein
VIASGFARGIDAEAHRASLANGTIGVLAGGLDKPYPPENLALFETMLETGLVITEMPFGWVPRGRDFPRRNRLISGLSLGVVVVEAARRSGSLITARMAGEQGREVFAVPGSPLDPRCEGTNDLLRSGANMAASVEDILAILRPLAGEQARAPLLFREAKGAGTDPGEDAYFDEAMGDGTALDPEPEDLLSGTEADESARNRLLSALSPTPVEVDVAARAAGLDPREAAALVFDLELDGEIERHPGGRISRR